MCVQKLETAGTAERRLIVSEGVLREFWVYLPSDYSSAVKYPVVVMHHGTGGNGQHILNTSGWRERAEKSKFIAAFPTACVNCYFKDGRKHVTTKWNAGGADYVFCNPAAIKDDVLFFRNLIDRLKANYAVDDDRIYSAGFSNGGQMSVRLAMEASDVIAAATFSGGTRPVDGAPVQRIPTWFTVGEKDDRFTALNDGQLLPMNGTLFDIPYFRGVTGDMLAAMQIGIAATEDSTVNTYTAHFGTLLNGGPPREHNVSVIRNLFHQYANGINNPVVYADLFWDFYSRYHK
jgi:dienelactone hydrolase